MGIFSRFREDALEPSWTYKSSGVIWRVLFAEATHIVGENRDRSKKSTSFFCVDRETGRIVWDDLQLDEKWWVGIEAVRRGVVLLHEYERPDMPTHKKIIALELQTGRMLWRNEELMYSFAAGGKVYGSRDIFSRRIFFELDCVSGQVCREIGDDFAQVSEIRKNGEDEDTSAEFLFPARLSDQPQAHPSISAILKKHCSLSENRGNIEVITLDRVLLFNYHRPVEDGTDSLLLNHFKIVDLVNQRVLFSEILDRSVAAPISDSFFVTDNTAYFIKDKNTLTSIKLPA
jgi:hypothetical protein